MNKICTSLEQSNILIELGIDGKTSDMYYWCGEDLRIGGYKAQIEEFDVPAWSLSALLEIMPKLERIGYEKSYPKIIRHNFTNKFYGHCLHYDTDMFDEPIDAAFEMVCWLLENKKI